MTDGAPEWDWDRVARGWATVGIGAGLVVIALLALWYLTHQNRSIWRDFAPAGNSIVGSAPSQNGSAASLDQEEPASSEA
jgi:hypothetical protein